MDVREALTVTERGTALSASFNQDSSCFSVGLEDGFAGRFLSHPFVYCVVLIRTELLISTIQYKVVNTEQCELRIHRSMYSSELFINSQVFFILKN